MNLNVDTLVVVAQRHARPVQGEGGLRPLSDRGVRQREAAKVAIDRFGPFDLVLSSPAERAKETVMREGLPLIVQPELYFPAEGSEDRKAIDAVYERLGDTPLRGHLASEAGSYLLLWAAIAVQAVVKRISEERAKQVLIGGHGVHTQALVLNLGLLMGVGVDAALATALAHGDALVVSRKGLEYLRCPEVE